MPLIAAIKRNILLSGMSQDFLSIDTFRNRHISDELT